MKYTRSPIHWRGYPHHHWPRIRLLKRKGSRSTQSASSIDNKLKKRRALQRARQNEEVFGWQSPLPGSRSKAATPDAILMVVPSSLKNSTDGADSPNPRNRSPAEARNQRKVIANHATTAKRNPSGIKSVDFGKKRTYDPRIDYKQHSRPKSPSKHIPISPSIRSFVHSLISIRSRTLSQRKALRRFTKELELHLQAVENLRGRSLIPSPSTTMVSVKTIQELMPYYEQFKSAGLAVTGAEQRERALRKPNRMPPIIPEGHQRYVALASLFSCKLRLHGTDLV
ncbi:hypothetical protein B0O99DRAFT_11254 [Bisporella sp. PMI_857]|nr:hypothetical protein B0O99DRAFT_11254 [Bisporella sp. PMI_857]